MEAKDKTSRKIEIESEETSEVKPAETSEDNQSEKNECSAQSCECENGNISEDSSPEEKPDEEPTCQEKLQQAEEKIKELNDKYVRSHAELENFKRRSRKEVSDFKKYAVEAIVKQLLPVFDNLERAVLSAESSDENSDSCQITQGVKMTLKEIDRVFEQFSIKSINAMGEKFDPNYHMAVGQEEKEDMESNIVVNQFQKGYMLHERLLRPAMVIVSKAKEKKEENNQADAQSSESTEENIQE